MNDHNDNEPRKGDNKFILMEKYGRNKLALFQIRKGDGLKFTSPYQKIKWDGVYYSAVTVYFGEQSQQITRAFYFDIKDRKVNVTTYPTLMIEKDKWDTLRLCAQQNPGTGAWYINTFTDDNVIIFDLLSITEPEWSVEKHNKSTAYNEGKKDKMVGYLAVSAGTLYNVYYDYTN